MAACLQKRYIKTNEFTQTIHERNYSACKKKPLKALVFLAQSRGNGFMHCFPPLPFCVSTGALVTHFGNRCHFPMNKNALRSGVQGVRLSRPTIAHEYLLTSSHTRWSSFSWTLLRRITPKRTHASFPSS